MAPRIKTAPEAWAAAFVAWKSGEVPATIARGLGMSETTLWRRIRQAGWPKRRDGRVLLGTPQAVAAAQAALATPSSVLAARVQEAVEREIAVVENILAGFGSTKITEAALGARALASLARTLRDLMNMRAPTRDGGDDEPEIRDLDEFRRDLCRRLDQLIAEAKAVCPEPSEGA